MKKNPINTYRVCMCCDKNIKEQKFGRREKWIRIREKENQNQKWIKIMLVSSSSMAIKPKKSRNNT